MSAVSKNLLISFFVRSVVPVVAETMLKTAGLIHQNGYEEIFKFTECRHGTRDWWESSAGIKERTHENGSVLLLISQHSEVSECIHDCLFFFWWANEFFALALTDIVIFSFLDTALVFGLCDVQGRDLQTKFLQDICLDVSVCGITAHILFEVLCIDGESDVVVGFFLTQKNNRLHMGRVNRIDAIDFY